MTRVSFIGAGSVVFTRQLLADLFGFPDLAGLEIALHDIDAERLAVAEGTARQVNERFLARARITTSLNRREALAGADFVINMIQVGGIHATRKDLEIPARHGLLQTIGDTTGIGGVFRALRTLPVLSGIAADIRDICPDAWLLNYTNPMAMNIRWLNEIAPEVKAVGLCHSVYWTVHDLCELIGVPVEGTEYRAAGVNHQAWLLEWSRDGENLYPRLVEAIEKDPGLTRRVRVEMFRRLGYFPTETSEHSSEYLDWFLRSPEQIEQFRIEPLQYVGISEENVAEFEHAKVALAAGEPLELEEGAAEYAPQVIHSMVTGTPRAIHANLPNHGLIDNLPADTVVEVPADVDGDGLRPRAMGSLLAQCAAVNGPYVQVGALTMRAMHEGDPELVRQAVLVDPNASSSLTPEQIWRLCDELTAAHGDLLPPALRPRTPRV